MEGLYSILVKKLGVNITFVYTGRWGENNIKIGLRNSDWLYDSVLCQAVVNTEMNLCVSWRLGHFFWVVEWLSACHERFHVRLCWNASPKLQVIWPEPSQAPHGTYVICSQTFGMCLGRGWRNVLRVCARIVCKFRRNTSACPWEFWRAK